MKESAREPQSLKITGFQSKLTKDRRKKQMQFRDYVEIVLYPSYSRLPLFLRLLILKILRQMIYGTIL